VAAAHAGEVLKRIPGFTIRGHCLPQLHYRRESDLLHHLEALRKAGLPDCPGLRGVPNADRAPEIRPESAPDANSTP
jgi:hypothetical protein